MKNRKLLLAVVKSWQAFSIGSLEHRRAKLHTAAILEPRPAAIQSCNVLRRKMKQAESLIARVTILCSTRYDASE